MLLPLLLALAQAPADHPHVVLTAAGAKLTVFTPDPAKGFYRGTRFAHSGIIKDLEVGGFKLFGPWKPAHDPLDADSITGPAEEFGMFDPLGYAEAKPGERFVKIGVGELVKAKDEPYKFQGRYDRGDAGRWTTVPLPDGVTTVHTLRSDTGFGYQYLKGVTLRPGGGGGVELVLTYELMNTGTKPIRTDVYNHNFFNVDGHPVGPRYRVEFPRPVKLTAESRFGPAARFDAGTYTFARPLADKESAFGWLTDADGRQLPHAFTLRYADDAGKAVNVRVAGSTPLTKFQTWSVRTCLCPEPFSAVAVEPGQSQKWATRYVIKAE